MLIHQNVSGAIDVNTTTIISPNSYAFIAIDDGVKGKMPASIGLQPVKILYNNTNQNLYLFIQYITLPISPETTAFQFTFSTDEKRSDDDETITIPYNLDARVAKLTSRRIYEEALPPINYIKKLQCRQIPFCVVSSETYSVCVYESSDFEELKKLPVSRLFPLFEWKL